MKSRRNEKDPDSGPKTHWVKEGGREREMMVPTPWTRPAFSGFKAIQTSSDPSGNSSLFYVSFHTYHIERSSHYARFQSQFKGNYVEPGGQKQRKHGAFVWRAS